MAADVVTLKANREVFNILRVYSTALNVGMGTVGGFCILKGYADKKFVLTYYFEVIGYFSSHLNKMYTISIKLTNYCEL